jgi:hypothetical protein
MEIEHEKLEDAMQHFLPGQRPSTNYVLVLDWKKDTVKTRTRQILKLHCNPLYMFTLAEQYRTISKLSK